MKFPAQTNHYLNIWLGLFVVSIDLKIVYVNLLFNFQSSFFQLLKFTKVILLCQLIF